MISSMENLYPLIQEALEQGKEAKFNVYGHSMEPFIYNGENVTLVKDKEYKKNDIILYRRTNGQFVLHRIYKVKKDGFVLLGDHQTFKEYPIYEKQIIGKVISYERKGKVKYLKGFKYHLFLLFWRRLILRKVILKFMRIKEKKQIY